MQEPLPNNSSWVKVYVCKHSLSSPQLRAGCHPKEAILLPLTLRCPHCPARISFLTPAPAFVGTCRKPTQKETSREQTHKNNKPSLLFGQTCSQKYFTTGPEQHQCWQKRKWEHKNQRRPKSGVCEGPGKPGHHFWNIYYLWDWLVLNMKKKKKKKPEIFSEGEKS